MQFNDNSVPGKYQQPIGSFAGRIVSNDVEEVDFIPGSNMRIWYNNRSEDYPVHRHSCLEITIPIEKSYTYIFDDRTIVLNEKEILMEKAMKEANGKPANIVEKMVEGRLSKELKDICLLDQIYVKAEDGKQTVGKYLESVDKDIKITNIVRFEVGEGIEKKQENFAEEVAKQMGM